MQGASSSVRALAEQVLASQRKFAEDVLKTTAPMLTGQDDAPARKKRLNGEVTPKRAANHAWFAARSGCLRY